MINGCEQWVTAEVVRTYLGEKDNQTVLRLARQGKIPGAKIAGQWKFKLSLVDKTLTDLVKTYK